MILDTFTTEEIYKEIASDYLHLQFQETKNFLNRKGKHIARYLRNMSPHKTTEDLSYKFKARTPNNNTWNCILTIPDKKRFLKNGVTSPMFYLIRNTKRKIELFMLWVHHTK